VTEFEFYNLLLWLQFIFAIVTAIILIFVVAPYGRHTRKGWGPTCPAALSWVIMELPAVLLFAFFFFTGKHSFELVPLVFLGMWQLHYVHRTFVFPFRMRSAGQRIPILILLLAIGFNTLNSYINARWIGHLGEYEFEWVTSVPFLLGSTLFLIGWCGNLHADAILRNLRKPGEVVYQIPTGGLYRLVSSPNYLYEILEWTGWAIATWSTAGLAFAVYTIANLAPRAAHHHIWYRSYFENYPRERKALIPYLF